MSSSRTATGRWRAAVAIVILLLLVVPIMLFPAARTAPALEGRQVKAARALFTRTALVLGAGVSCTLPIVSMMVFSFNKLTPGHGVGRGRTLAHPSKWYVALPEQRGRSWRAALAVDPHRADLRRAPRWGCWGRSPGMALGAPGRLSAAACLLGGG